MTEKFSKSRAAKKLEFFEKKNLKIQKPRKMTLGNDVENTFAKFHRNQSMGKVFKIRTTEIS